MKNGTSISFQKSFLRIFPLIGIIALFPSASYAKSKSQTAKSNVVELKCEGILYVNNKSGQRQYQIDISVTIDSMNNQIKVDGRGFFSSNHMITKATPQKYYIISNADYQYRKTSGYKDSDSDGYTWSSTLDRTNGYLVLIEGPIDGDRNAFNGTCTQAKPIF